MELVAASFATTRLHLDPLRVDDADAMLAIYADVRMYEFTGGTAPTAEQLRSRYRAMVAGHSPTGDELWLNWIVRLLGSRTVIGAVQATVLTAQPHGYVAWEIGVPWQGQGYAGEAAAALVSWLDVRGITTVEAHVHPRHVASQRVAGRAGLAATVDVVDGEEVWRLQAR